MTTLKTRSWTRWLWLVVIVLALVFGVLRALKQRSTQRAAASEAAVAMQQAPVYALSAADVVAVQNLALTQTVSISGSLKALQTAVIKARVAGEVQGLAKREGDKVRAGEVLATIDTTEAQARVRQASQQAEAAQAQVQIARRTLDNSQALVRQGFISATALETASANLAAAEASHQAALAARDIAQKSLTDTTLRSPISGQISARWVNNGERVGIDARMLDVVDLSGFELEAALAPADAAAVLPGLPVSLQIEGLAEPVTATVARINPSVQVGSRSVLVYLRVSPRPGMRQGLFAQGHIVTGQVQALALPASALRNDQPQPYVQVVRNGQVQHQTVKPGVQGLWQGEPMVALDGLPAGAVVLRAQAGLMRPGTAVRLPDTPATAAPVADTASR
ncbi:MAG: hypothetical protein RLZZ352_1331 [Pseudomonadota bacterium]|jgi:RND family efflux transporter MFP subunit